MSKEKIKEKVEKEFPEFVDTMSECNKDSLEKNLSIYAKYREELELGKAIDPDLNAAKERLKELNQKYAPGIKALKMKLAYINILLEELKESAE